MKKTVISLFFGLLLLGVFFSRNNIAQAFNMQSGSSCQLGESLQTNSFASGAERECVQEKF